MDTDLDRLRWFKSSASSSHGCVEIAHLPDGGVAVRDSKDRHGPILTFDRAVFAALFEQRDVGTWTARHSLTWGESGQPDTMEGQSELAYAAGQVPRCLAVYGDANDHRFAGIWWEARDGIIASWWLGDGDFYQLSVVETRLRALRQEMSEQQRLGWNRAG